MKHVVALLLLAAAVPLLAADANDAKTKNPDARRPFALVVARLLKTHCASCHESEEPEGNVALHDVGVDPSDGVAVATWSRVLEQLEIGAMPPEDESQPTAAERQRMIDWIKQTLTLAGKGFELQVKLLLPEYGNRVSHELLFSGEIKTPSYTPARLWRMSPHVYRGKRYQLTVAGGVESQPVAYSSKSSG
ncbi:MAG: cytochrome c, partial [Planctomycetales bacterium]